jgi:hypothetical protein
MPYFSPQKIELRGLVISLAAPMLLQPLPVLVRFQGL